MKGLPTLGWTEEKVTEPFFVGVGHGDHHLTGGGHLVLVELTPLSVTLTVTM